MAVKKPLVEGVGEVQNLQPGDTLDVGILTNPSVAQKTGIIKGWVPTEDTGTTVNISAGNGYIVNNETDPNLPVVNPINTPAFLEVTVTAVVAESFTFFYLDVAQSLQQQNTAPTRSEARTKLFVAVAYHPGTEVLAVYPMGTPAFEGDFFAHDMVSDIKTNGSFVDLATVGGLQMKVSAGDMGYSNANRQDSPAARRDPHFVAQLAVDPFTFVSINNDGSDGIDVIGLAETDLDTLFRSDGLGGLTLIANNRSTLQVIYREPQGAMAIEYTVAEFNPSQQTAEEAFTEAITIQPLVVTFPFDAIYIIEIPRAALTIDACILHRIDFSTVAGGVIGGDDPTTRRMATEDKSTGIVNGGIITVNGGDPALFDISDGNGWVIDSYSTPESIQFPVAWVNLTGIALTNILTQSSTFVALDKTQPVPVVVQQAGPFSVDQFRDLIVLGRVLHTDNATVTDIVQEFVPTFDVLLTAADFLSSFGPFNLEGNVYGSTGANLIPAKTAGKTFKLGANFGVSKKDQNRTTDLSDSPLSFGYLFRDPGEPDGFNILVPQTAFNPNIYDFGDGTTPAVTVNKWTYQTLYFFPKAGTGGTHRFHLGQAIYQSKQDAVDAIVDEPITADPFLDTAVRRGWLVVQEGATDLTDENEACFFEASDIAFGGGGGGTGAANSDVALVISPPHLVGPNKATIFVPSVSRNVVEIVVQAGAITSASEGSFTFDLYHGPTLGSLTLIDFISVTQGTERASKAITPFPIPANDLFVVNIIAIGNFPIATQNIHKRFYFHIRMTP